jgi:hypothetical protein
MLMNLRCARKENVVFSGHFKIPFLESLSPYCQSDAWSPYGPCVAPLISMFKRLHKKRRVLFGVFSSSLLAANSGHMIERRLLL